MAMASELSTIFFIESSIPALSHFLFLFSFAAFLSIGRSLSSSFANNKESSVSSASCKAGKFEVDFGIRESSEVFLRHKNPASQRMSQQWSREKVVPLVFW